MLCVFFKIRAECPLKKMMKKLVGIYDDVHKDASTRRISLLTLEIIIKAISYAAGCPKSEFEYIQGNENASWVTKNFSIVNPFTHKLLHAKDVKLIKNIGKNNRPDIKDSPIFELRVNELDGLDIGFRCVFFVTGNYECYIKPFYKERYYGNGSIQLDKKARERGKGKTDNAAITTFNAYKTYKSNPNEFKLLFNHDNLISNFLTRGVMK